MVGGVPDSQAAEVWLSSYGDTEAFPQRIAARQSPEAVARLAALADAIDPRIRRLPNVHVAGSKGKGSCVFVLDFLLRQAGRRVVRHTSPQVEGPWDQLGLDGQTLSRAQWREALGEFHLAAAPHVPPPSSPDAPSRFELATLFHLHWMMRQNPDVAIIETGLGGLFDATNIVSATRVALITVLGFEHIEQLGSDIASIARHKLGIARPQTPLVLSRQPSATSARVLEIARGVSRRLDAPLLLPPPLAPEVMELLVPVFPRHQIDNIGACVEVVRAGGYAPSRKPLSAWLATLPWHHLALPYRLEYLRRDPPVVLDGAHCPLSMNRLVKSLRDDTPETRWRVVLLVMRDKDIAGICDELRRLPVQELHALRSADPRACEPERLLSAAVEAGVVSADRAAILDSLASMPPGVHEGLLVTGSYRHLSEARRCFASDAVE